MYKTFAQLGAQPDQTVDTPKETNNNITEITSASQRQELLQSNKVVCIKFYADWCIPCKNVTPFYQQLAATRQDAVFAQENVELRLTPDVKKLPSFYIYQDGKLVETVEGPNTSIVSEKIDNLVMKTNRLSTPTLPNGMSMFNKSAIKNFTSRDNGHTF